MRQGKVLIVNLIIVLTAVASIVTLYLGSFLQIDLKLHVNDKNAQEIVSAMGGEETIDVSALGEFSIVVPVKLTIKNTDTINSVFGDRTKVTSDVLTREIKGVMEGLFSAAKEVMKVATNVIVNKALDEAEKAIEEQLGSEDSAASVLAEQYGVSQEAIADLKSDVSAAVNTVLNGGDSDDIRDILDESETLNSILQAYAEAELKEELGVDELTEEQKEQATAKAAEKKNDVLQKYDEVVEQYGTEDENGEKKITSESIVAGVFNQAGVKDSDGNEVKIETEEDLQNFLVEKVNGFLSANEQYVGYGLMGLGIFILIVMASWAYVVLKIVVKLFMKNKTVRFGLPQAFGWMPHVFFIGLPMTIVKLASFIVEKAGAQLGEDVQKIVNMATTMISLDLHSLTWVSAAGTVVLLVLSFFYYKWRKEIKRDIKSGNR